MRFATPTGMVKILYIMWVMVLMLIVVVMSGCQSEQPAPWAQEPIPPSHAFFTPRSIVFESADQRRLAAEARATDSGRLAWYHVRRDARLAADAGYASPAVERTVSLTIDRQYNSGGQVRDSFNQRTYRADVREGVR